MVAVREVRGPFSGSADIEVGVTRYPIGLVGDLDHLRPHLESASFNPHGGSFGHPDTTSDIDALLRRDLRTPLLVSVRDSDPTWSSWFGRLLDSGARVVVVGDLPGGLGGQRCKRLDASASLADALIACGASRAMVPENFASVPLAAPRVDRFNGGSSEVSTTHNGSSAPSATATQISVLDRPATPRRSAPSPSELEDEPVGGRLHRPARAAAPEPVTAPPFIRPATPASAQTGPSAPSAVSAASAVSGRTAATPYSAPSADTGTQPAVPTAQPSPAPQPVPSTPAQPQPASVLDIFDRPDEVNPHALADIIIVFGARGGLGKTSIAQAIAGTSASRKRRTILVDANKGQGDQALLLRLDPHKPVPSAYDTARTGRPDDAFASPDLLNELRGARRDRVEFALVAAPPESIPGAATVTTPGVYRSIIDFASHIGDLVVVDTRPIKPSEPSDMVTDLILPLLRAGAWGVGLTDSSIPGLKHLEEALEYLIEQGVPQDRLMTVINRVPPSANLNMDLLGSRLSRRSHWIGPIFTDDEDVQNRSNAGIVLVGVNTMAHQVENTLNRVCGLEVLTAPPGEKRKGFLRLFGRGR